MASITSTTNFILRYILCFLLTSLLFHAAPLQVSGKRHHHHHRKLVSAPAEPPATNCTSHGHHWIGPVGNRTITVSINGSADFRSVQAAIDSVEVNNRVNVTIKIGPGIYK